MPAGRPTLYKPEYCEKVIELGKQGKSQVQIACALGVLRTTMIEWTNQHPEFLTALTRAKHHEQDWWENEGQTALRSDKFNSAVWSKSMSARFKQDYTDRQAVTDSKGDDLQSADPRALALALGTLIAEGQVKDTGEE